MTKETFQERYDDIQSQMKALESEIKENGFFVQKNTVQKDKETIGMFWEVTHLYDYQGDGIYLCHYSKDATEMTKEQLKTFVTALKEKDFKTSSDFLENIMNADSDVIDLIEEAILNLDETSDDLEIEIDLDSDDAEIGTGQVVDGSTFSIRKCKLSDILLFERDACNTTYCV